ncbi:MAG: hypothetical protein DMG38_04380 [Acidobacteria bacterium]|nr:MAG: hypothetical protein DMG38_04380 [Acidobacteriota bacterium]
MFTQISGTAGTVGEKPKSGALALLAVMGLPAILGVLLAWRVLNRWVALEVEEGPDGSSAALRTPMGMVPLRGNESLLKVVYRDSTPLQATWLDWKGTSASSSNGKRQLVVLTFQSRTTLQRLESWYQKKLGANFSQTKGWLVAGGKEASSWVRRVEPRSQPEGISFRQELSHRIRGVLILPGGGAGQGSEIKLYDYMESPGQ